ncbi:tetratricopeptide repeat protein [Pseudobythopirellula maris]|uniref:tetratricopeptide repeat protein n=1 Tax=Pseudobythopirellula maris TaxID=2527991 RepID=UPI0011B7F71A|nr:tetratricopeptide repeat protein [Pseudobythopirellula maris]
MRCTWAGFVGFAVLSGANASAAESQAPKRFTLWDAVKSNFASEDEAQPSAAPEKVVRSQPTRRSIAQPATRGGAQPQASSFARSGSPAAPQDAARTPQPMAPAPAQSTRGGGLLGLLGFGDAPETDAPETDAPQATFARDTPTQQRMPSLANRPEMNRPSLSGPVVQPSKTNNRYASAANTPNGQRPQAAGLALSARPMATRPMPTAPRWSEIPTDKEFDIVETPGSLALASDTLDAEQQAADMKLPESKVARADFGTEVVNGPAMVGPVITGPNGADLSRTGGDETSPEQETPTPLFPANMAVVVSDTGLGEAGPEELDYETTTAMTPEEMTVVISDKAQLEPPMPTQMASPLGPVSPALAASEQATAAPAVESDAPADAQQPTEAAARLLAMAHAEAKDAKTEAELTTIIQRCQYVLAIDQSEAAVGYSQQLAAWSFLKRGELKAHAGNDSEARLDFEDALAMKPGYTKAVIALGELLARTGDYDAATERFDTAIELKPQDAMPHAFRATMHVFAGEYEAAVETYQHAISLQPDLAMAHQGCGRTLHLLGRHEEALRHADAASLLMPEDAEVAVARADLLTDMGRYAQAAAGYRRAIELNDSLPAAFLGLAWLEATCPDKSVRNPEGALNHVNRACKLTDEVSDVTLDTAAAAMAAMGRYDEAAEVLERAIALAPEEAAGAYRQRLAGYRSGVAYTSPTASVVRQVTFEQPLATPEF